MKTKFKIGDRVFDIRHGWGVVKYIYPDRIYGVFVLFDNEFKRTAETYTEDGKYLNSNPYPILSHFQYAANMGERVIRVRGSESNEWINRVLIKIKNGKAVCWSNAKTIEEADDELSTSAWNYWEELTDEQVIELTIQDISEGRGVGVPPHLIRIKDC